jgi:hypothetical protein
MKKVLRVRNRFLVPCLIGFSTLIGLDLCDRFAYPVPNLFMLLVSVLALAFLFLWAWEAERPSPEPP